MADVINTVLTADDSAHRAAFERAAAQVRNFTVKSREQLDRAKGGTRNFSQGLLEVSRAAEDAQYGLRGVLNNLPGIVMGLGGGAGVAGAISLVAVGATALAPKLAKLFGGENQKEVDAYKEKLEEVVKKLESAAAERGRMSATKFVEALRAEEKAFDKQNVALGLNVKLMEARARAQGMISAAGAALEIARIESDPTLSPEQKNARKTEVQKGSERTAAAARVAEIERTAKAVEAAAKSEYDAVSRVQERLKSLRDQAMEEEQQQAELRKKMNGEAALAAASLPGLQQRIKDMTQLKFTDEDAATFSGGPQQRAQQATALIAKARADAARAEETARGGGIGDRKRMAEMTDSLAVLQKEIAAEEALEKQKVATANAAGKERDAALKRAMIEKDAIQKSLNLRLQELDVIERGQNLQSQGASGGGGSGGIGSSGGSTSSGDSNVKAARESFVAEGKILRLRAQGRLEAAAALDEERRAREGAVELAKKLGVTEGEGLKLMRQRIAEEKGAARGAIGVPDKELRNETLRKIGGDRPGGGLRRERLESSGGLRDAPRRIGLREQAINQAAKDKRMNGGKSPSADPAIRYFDKIATGIDMMNQKLEKLGVV